MQTDIRLVSIAALLGGCASAPITDHGHHILPSDVQRLVQCELELAVRGVSRSEPALESWGGEYAVTLETERSAGAGLDALDWVIPSSDHDLSLGVGLSVSDKKTESTVITGQFAWSRTPSPYCIGYDGNNPTFRGKLGIEQWLRNSIGSSQYLPTQVGKTLEFAVNVDGSISPAAGATNISAHFGVIGGYQTTHTLVATFHDITPPQPQKVTIVGTLPKHHGVAPKKGAGEKRAHPGDFLQFMILNTQTNK